MLVLSRCLGEAIRINNDITVVVVSTGPGKVRLGIEAPHEIPVNREEIQVQLENQGRQFIEAKK